MPLLEIVTSKKVTATIALEDSTAKQIDQYAAFTKASADEVVNKALEYVFSKDKDFQRFCDENTSAKPMVALRMKKATTNTTKPTQQSSRTVGA